MAIKKNVKSIFQSVLCILTVVVLLGAIVVVFRPNTSEKPTEPNTPEIPIEPSEPITPIEPNEPNDGVEYTITYRMVANGTEEDIYEPLFRSDGEYPTVYTEGDRITISDLNGKVTKTPVPDSWGMDGAYTIKGDFTDPNNSNRTFEFYGWFLDSECTLAVSDNTIYNASGDITLYAKIFIGIWSNFY